MFGLKPSAATLGMVGVAVAATAIGWWVSPSLLARLLLFPVELFEPLGARMFSEGIDGLVAASVVNVVAWVLVFVILRAAWRRAAA